MKRYIIQLPEDLANKIKESANKKWLSFSAYIRMILTSSKNIV